MSSPFDALFPGLESGQRDPRYFGLLYGEVVKLTDEGPMVMLHSGQCSEPVGPARVATFMAGPGRGAHFMPEEGDEVVVGFELGNPANPCILGALWNDQQSPPAQVSPGAPTDVRTIVSRAKHEVTFDDSQSGLKLTLKSGVSHFEITLQDAPTPRITIKTTGLVASSLIELDGIAWNHQHATGVGPSGPPLSILPVP